jgi:hypothetical protein
MLGHIHYFEGFAEFDVFQSQDMGIPVSIIPRLIICDITERATSPTEGLFAYFHCKKDSIT